MTSDTAVPSAEVASKSLWVSRAARRCLSPADRCPPGCRRWSGAPPGRRPAGDGRPRAGAPVPPARPPLPPARGRQQPKRPALLSARRPRCPCAQVGDLQPWMDESFLYNIFVSTNQLVSVKLIRNRATGQSEGAHLVAPRPAARSGAGWLPPVASATQLAGLHTQLAGRPTASQLPSRTLLRCLSARAALLARPAAGYAFLEFRTHEAADMLLKSYNGQPIPGTDQVFRLNWAAYGVGKAQPPGEGAAGVDAVRAHRRPAPAPAASAGLLEGGACSFWAAWPGLPLSATLWLW